MIVILSILKALVVFIYVFFLLDAILNLKHSVLDEEGQEKSNLVWLDMVYFAYALFNLILVIKFLHR